MLPPLTWLKQFCPLITIYLGDTSLTVDVVHSSSFHDTQLNGSHEPRRWSMLTRSLPLARRALRRAWRHSTTLSIDLVRPRLRLLWSLWVLTALLWSVHRQPLPTSSRAFSSPSASPDGDDRKDASASKKSGQPSEPTVAAPSSWWDEVRETYARARARTHVFEEFEAAGVFQPSSSRLARLSNWYLFYQLNRPRETQLNMVEFLEGAKHAMETTMMAMYSREFAAFATRSQKTTTGDLDESSPVHLLSTTLEPVSLEAFTEFVCFSSAAGIRSELQKLELHSAHVVGVTFTRVPMRPATNSSGAVVVGVPMHERMAIQVLFDVTEHFRMTLPGENGDEESAIDDEEVVVRNNKAVWQFTSNVTTADDIEWIIEPLDLATM